MRLKCRGLVCKAGWAAPGKKQNVSGLAPPLGLLYGLPEGRWLFFLVL